MFHQKDRSRHFDEYNVSFIRFSALSGSIEISWYSRYDKLETGEVVVLKTLEIKKEAKSHEKSQFLWLDRNQMRIRGRKMIPATRIIRLNV